MKRDVYFDHFFPHLSPQLTSRIAQANTEMLVERADVDYVDKDELDREEDEDFDVEEEAAPSKFTRGETMPSDQLEECERTTRERLYSYLAFLARNERSQSEGYPIFEVLPRPMGHLLGIGASRFRELPLELTREFRDWLAEQEGMTFQASWGWMRLLGDSYLRLLAEQAERDEPRRYTRDSFPAYRRRSDRHR